MMKSIALSESCLYASATTTAEEDFVIVEAPPTIPSCQMQSLLQVALCEDEYDDESSYDYCEDVFGALDEEENIRHKNTANKILITSENTLMTSHFFVPQKINDESSNELPPLLPSPPQQHCNSFSLSTAPTQTSDHPIGASATAASDSPNNSDASSSSSSSLIMAEDDHDGQSVVKLKNEPTTTTKLKFKRISNKKRRKQLKLAKKVTTL